MTLDDAHTQELLGQTSHYSEKMRQSALSGLSDLFARHPEELAQHVGLVCSRCAAMVSSQYRLPDHHKHLSSTLPFISPHNMSAVRTGTRYSCIPAALAFCVYVCVCVCVCARMCV